MWVVRVGDSLYVRSAYGPDSAWYRRADRHGRGRIRAGGVERDVVLDHLTPDDPVHAEIDDAYHAKYDQYGPRSSPRSSAPQRPRSLSESTA